MPLKECAYSLQHTGKNDPNPPALSAKALTEIGSVLIGRLLGSDPFIKRVSQ